MSPPLDRCRQADLVAADRFRHTLRSFLVEHITDAGLRRRTIAAQSLRTLFLAPAVAAGSIRDAARSSSSDAASALRPAGPRGRGCAPAPPAGGDRAGAGVHHLGHRLPELDSAQSVAARGDVCAAADRGQQPGLDPQSRIRDLVFETVVDVIDDYFKVDHEIPIRLEGDVLVEGLIDTFPRSGSTILEPWGRDAANFYERVEGTLQSIRRQALVRVIPAEGGFLVDVVVVKELEDVLRPEAGSASRAANLRNDNSLRRYIDPVTGTQPTHGLDRAGPRRGPGAEDSRRPRLAVRGRDLPPPPVAPVAEDCLRRA